MTMRALKYPKIGHNLDTLWTYFGYNLDTFYIYFGQIVDTSWTHLGHILDTSWTHVYLGHRHIGDISECSRSSGLLDLNLI